MRSFFLFAITGLLVFSVKGYSQQAVSQSITTLWGNYVKTNLPGQNSYLMSLNIDDGHNRKWNGLFSINGENSYTPTLAWNNVKLLAYSVYNTSKDDVKLLVMSNTAASSFGGTEVIIKFASISTYTAYLNVTVFGGENLTALSLVDNSTTAPFPYTVATSEGTLNTWVVNNNVGIGTMNPRTPLDLGELRFGRISQFPADGTISDTDWPNFLIGSDSYRRLRMGLVKDGNIKAEIELDNSNRPDGTIAFKTTDGSGAIIARMFVHGNGNVGIGTNYINISEYKLAVNGTIGSKKVKVVQTGWPDYVFEEEYDLRPLGELEAYIKRNKHLPDIFSAAEIEKKGLDLGDNQAALLRKVEELTLYLIEQNKKMEGLQKEVEVLRNKCTLIDQIRKELDAIKGQMEK